MQGSLTICSVVYGDRLLLDRNAALTAALNPGEDVIWRMVVNQPVNADDRPDRPGPFTVIPGTALTPQEQADPLWRSLHHAQGLNLGVRDVTTRFLVILDADCFIVRPRWIRDVIQAMQDRELAFFGTPYHPRSIAKLRYFPCCVCLFVDLQRVDPTALDFTPEPWMAHNGGGQPLARLVERRLRASGMDIRTRPQRSRDTGIRVYTRFRDDRSTPSACVTPVLTERDLRGVLRRPVQLVLEKLLPDRWCLVPRRPDAFTDRTFASLGAPDLHARGCEEYLWCGEPFAFHLRGAGPALRTEPAELDRLLAGFTL